MRRVLLTTILALILVSGARAQFTTEGRPITGSIPMPKPQNMYTRSAQKPTQCGSDTSTYPSFGTTGYYSVTIKSGSSLGQFYPVPGPMTISGFEFMGFSLSPTPARPTPIKLRCNIYKAGADSLPSGAPLASDTITVDTVMGASIPLAHITHIARFRNPVTLTSGGYILAVECDSAAVSAALITNSWAKGDGKKQNLACGSVSGKWYRCLNLNISGTTFDVNVQLYAIVKYKLGTDFSIVNQCYANSDTVKFQNTNKSNFSGSVFYNFYIYYGLEQYSHRWTYDNIYTEYAINGKYKPSTKRNFDARLITTVYSYRSGQCYDTAVKSVYFKPSVPSPKKQPRACRGDTFTIDLVSDAGAVVKWFRKSSDTTPFFTGTSYTLQNVQNNDSFYIRADNGICRSALTKINFLVYDYPSAPVADNDSICSGAIANLGASSNKGVIEWYTGNSGGLPIFLGNSKQTDKLYADTVFWVQANNAGCLNKGGRVKVQAFVSNDFAPSSPVIAADTYTCYRPVKAMTLSASQAGSDTLRWFDVPSGGKVLGRGPSYTYTPASRGDADLYVETWNGVCGSGRSKTTIHVYDYPTVFGLKGDTICKGEIAFPHLTTPWGAANWYIRKSTDSVVFTGGFPGFDGLLKNTKYYIKTEENGCVSTTWDSVMVLVNTAPVPTLVKADPVCAKGLGQFKVTVPKGVVNWYEKASDPAPFYTGTTINTGMMLSNLTYYYETVADGCPSAKTPLTITIKPRPVAGFTWNLVWQNKLVCTPITTNGLTIFWDWGDGKTQNGTPYNHTYDSKGNYTVRMVATSTANGCKDTADIPVIVDHTGVITVHGTEVSVYPVPVKSGSVLTVQGIANSNGQVILYGTDGRIVATLSMTDRSIQLPGNLSPGVYLLQLQTSSGPATARIVLAD